MAQRDDDYDMDPKVVLEPGPHGRITVSIYESYYDDAPLIELDLDREAAEALAVALARFARADA